MSATEDADSGQTTIEQEAARLAELSGAAWVRATLERNNDGEFRATRIELTIGAEPRGFEWLDWDYGSCALVSCPTSPSEIAAWLSDGHGAVKPQVRNIEFAMPSVAPTGTWENLPSRSSRDRPALEWPYRRAVFHEIEPRAQLVLAAFLVSPDAPSFPTFDLASEVFFHGDERSFTPMTSYDALIIREQTSDVRIARVAFSMAEVIVTLDTLNAGDRAPIKVSFVADGVSIGDDRIILGFSKDRTSVFALPSGVPSEWWLTLSRGTRWLDFRYSSRYYQPADVDLETEALDAEDAVLALMFGGEDAQTEFKRELPTDDAGKRKLARVVAAFANGGGGVILFGIDADEATIIGIGDTFPKARDRLTDIVSGNVTPSLNVDVRAYEIPSRLVVGLVVPSGDTPPYGAGRTNPRYYVRRNASTLPAQPDDIRRVVGETRPRNRGR
jgi:hypothetical protein